MHAPQTNSSNRRHYASELRREDQTPKVFREAADELTRIAAELAEAAAKMDETGIKRLNVDGVRKMPNALKLARAYVGNVQKAWIDLQNRGRRGLRPRRGSW